MPVSTKCIHKGTRIDVGRALQLRAKAGKGRLPATTFLCVECGNPVKPHRGSGHGQAHFEHYRRNASCSLSHRPRQSNRRSAVADFGLDDMRAIEGYERDRSIVSYSRNARIVAACKRRDKHTCQACGFRLKISSIFVIECHHTRPLAENGPREVSLDELVCLCPTCHRIAHTRKIPFSIQEIQSLLEDDRTKPC